MNLTILVIDDETSVRDMLSTYLQHHGFSVMTAGTGEEAMQQRQNQRFDLITMDVELPDVNGLDLLAKIRSVDRDTPIIVATGNNPTPVLINTARRNGASGFASKTAPLPELLAQVQSLIG